MDDGKTILIKTLRGSHKIPISNLENVEKSEELQEMILELQELFVKTLDNRTFQIQTSSFIFNKEVLRAILQAKEIDTGMEAGTETIDI